MYFFLKKKKKVLNKKKEKTTTIGLIIYKHSTRTRSHQLVRGMTEGKIPHPCGNTKKSWTHFPPSFP